MFNWIGKYSNVIERSRGAEIAVHIQHNKDMGYNGTSPVITISEERTTCSNSQIATFWRLLGSLDGPKRKLSTYAVFIRRKFCLLYVLLIV